MLGILTVVVVSDANLLTGFGLASGRVFGPVQHHRGAGLPALIQQCLASVLLPALVGPGGVGLSHRPVMSLPLAQLLQVERLQPL